MRSRRVNGAGEKYLYVLVSDVGNRDWNSVARHKIVRARSAHATDTTLLGVDAVACPPDVAVGAIRIHHRVLLDGISAFVLRHSDDNEGGECDLKGEEALSGELKTTRPCRTLPVASLLLEKRVNRGAGEDLREMINKRQLQPLRHVSLSFIVRLKDAVGRFRG